MRETRQRILAVATGLLLEDGYGAMTVAGLARAAGVSPQTVYNSVGGKAEVVKAAYDVLLAGDASPLPMSDRPEFRAVTQAPDSASYGTAYAAWTRGIYDRVGGFLAALPAHGSAGDPVLDEFLATIDRERRVGNEHSIPATLRKDLGPHLPRVVDILWLLTAPEVHERLSRRAGWTPDEYERWLACQLERAITDPRHNPRAVRSDSASAPRRTRRNKGSGPS
jgi:AcrR family transcriptional regulator